jgi:MFS transporter, PPP family, 3-phenylpropionic acid transporter
LNPEREGTSLRLYYFFYFCAIGALEPYLNLYFRHLGFSGRQIGLLSGSPGLIHAIFPFLWGALADARRQRNGIFLLNTWATPLALCLLLSAQRYLLIFLAILLFAIFRSPLIALLNAFALQYGKEREIDYGRLRVWGSLGYILAAIVLGRLIDLHSPRIALYGALGGFLLCGLTWGKGFPWKGGQVGFKREFAQIWRERRLLVFLLVGLLTWMSWAAYSNFFTIHLEELGISKGFAGWAWALGVVSEVVVMFGWGRIASRFRPRDLLTFALLFIAVRWFLFSLARGAAAILAIQLLHGVTFATFYLSSMVILDGMVPPGLRATGQGMYSALTFGLGSFLGGVISGLLFDQWGMAVLFRLSSLMALLALWLYVGSRRS